MAPTAPNAMGAMEPNVTLDRAGGVEQQHDAEDDEHEPGDQRHPIGA